MQKTGPHRRVRIASPAMFAAAVAGFTAALLTLAWSFSPRLSAPPAAPDPGELRQLREALAAEIDPRNPVRLHVEVDYAQGTNAAWYPRHESPILADLVRDGKLPPVAERVGPEPCVYRGVEGLGQYGGTWVGLGFTPGYRLSASTLVRWSPQGYPLVPHIARAWTNTPDFKTFEFRLRQGMRWSDGHPFSADDILYWWEHEATDKRVMGSVPQFMLIRGKPGRVEKVDDLTVRFVFPESHGLFLPMLAMKHGVPVVGAPQHYLRRYHPDPAIGDAAFKEKEKSSRSLTSDRDLYLQIKDDMNPDHPRLWPWLYHTYKPNPPFTFVRNPYYWMVDEAGNQLPYVDQCYSREISKDMMATALAGREYTMGISKNSDYNLIVSMRKQGDYRVYRWFRADRSDAMIHVNLNRSVVPDKPDLKWKHRYLNDKRFRRALSQAIDRQPIIDAIYFGETLPAQCAPGPSSFFHHAASMTNYTVFNPAEANRLLDEVGLTRRDRAGYRCAPDGTRLTFFLHHMGWLQPGVAQFVVEDWGRVGIRTVPKMQAGALFYTQKAARLHDFTVWTGENEFIPTLDPRVFLPSSDEASFAIGYGSWYLRGGLYGDPASQDPSCIPIPEDHPLREALTCYERVKATGDLHEQKRLFDKVLDIQADNLWTIGICTSPEYVVNVRNDFRNIPPLAAFTFAFLAPGNTGQETYFFDKNAGVHEPGVAGRIKQEIMTITPAPDTAGAIATAHDTRGTGPFTRRTVRALLWIVAGLTVAGIAVRHPYIGKRILIMVPTLFIVSIMVFFIIQLPPGDFLTAKIAELQSTGDQIDRQQLQDIKDMYHLDDPMAIRYARWMGLYWFRGLAPRVENGSLGFALDRKDEGLLQGNLGRSMATNKMVTQVVGDRITLTLLLSLASILITWALALPLGIYSAVRQYSVMDYVLTFVGFIGMCVPSFLLAVVFLYVTTVHFDYSIMGLFSGKFERQPFWDWPRFVDLVRHLWMPAIILGIGGIGGMLRVMRANLLDEVKKPYVTTARAKGVRPLKLLLKYPVRLALNPFISGIGGLFPAMISGGVLISVVLNLPTVGPLMLEALLNEDTMLAGSMLVVLSLLGVIGTLVSDLLLLWVDPRIRFEQGSR